jgi:hypothetical protein
MLETYETTLAISTKITKSLHTLCLSLFPTNFFLIISFLPSFYHLFTFRLSFILTSLSFSLSYVFSVSFFLQFLIPLLIGRTVQNTVDQTSSIFLLHMYNIIQCTVFIPVLPISCTKNLFF